jgi:hypothetical protein
MKKPTPPSASALSRARVRAERARSRRRFPLAQHGRRRKGGNGDAGELPGAAAQVWERSRRRDEAGVGPRCGPASVPLASRSTLAVFARVARQAAVGVGCNRGRRDRASDGGGAGGHLRIRRAKFRTSRTAASPSRPLAVAAQRVGHQRSLSEDDRGALADGLVDAAERRGHRDPGDLSAVLHARDVRQPAGVRGHAGGLRA